MITGFGTRLGFKKYCFLKESIVFTLNLSFTPTTGPTICVLYILPLSLICRLVMASPPPLKGYFEGNFA